MENSLVMKPVEKVHLNGLDKKTKSILKKECFFVKEYIADDGVMFYELQNIDGETVRVFPERVEFKD
jgi:hypothetical protein